MQIKAHEADKYLQQTENYHAVILIYGVDEGSVSERADTVAQTLQQSNDDPFSLVRLDADDVSATPGILADEMNTIALFGGKRTIRVKNYRNRAIHKSVEAVLDSAPQEAHLIIEAGDLKKNQPAKGAG